MTQRLRIVVSGLIAQYPLGGVAWDYLQYVLGLHRLGHDVVYLEDTGQWPYHPAEGGLAKTCAHNVAHLSDVMARYGLGERWGYRSPVLSRWQGLSDRAVTDFVASADLLLNVSGVLADPAAYRGAGCLVYIDTDPVFTQVKLARGQDDFRRAVNLHDRHYSFGEALPGNAPDSGHRWRPTRQPVVLSEWPPGAPRPGVFTTVMNWTSYKPVEHAGRRYGQKNDEFLRFLELPARVAPAVLELAINAGKTERTPYERLRRHGWQTVDPDTVCASLDGYRDYIASSYAEFSVAKHGYVQGRAGWFSGRSACYLASGKPVVVQDTGFADVLPVGRGLLSFSNFDEAVAAIAAVRADYALHAAAALDVAREHFDAGLVLTRLVEDALS